MVRSTGTTDEDNKSTSSSACEDGSAVLSSGKSGNSLDSSEMENIESGIGTASPPKDMVKQKIDQYLNYCFVSNSTSFSLVFLSILGLVESLAVVTQHLTEYNADFERSNPLDSTR